MKTDRIIGLLAGVLVVSLAGCGDVNTTGFLAMTQASGITITGDGCGAPDKKLVPPLFYDAGTGQITGDEYLLGLWFRNNLVANDDTEGTSTGRINTNPVQVNRIVVEFPDREHWGFLPASANAGMPFTVDTEAEVGWPSPVLPLAIGWELVNNAASPIREASATKMVSLPIRIRAEGSLMDGTAVESNEFDLTLTVCNGCLGGCPVGYELSGGCSVAQPDLYTCDKAEDSTSGQ